MVRNVVVLLLFAVVAAPAPAAVTFDWAYVGNAGNAADPQTRRGAVSYEYAIAKHEVTNAQYAEFLNAVDPTGANTRSIYNQDMLGNFGGIEKTGTTDGARYVLQAGRERNPVTYVSFYDAMRFTNWLHNGQGSGDTETGVYSIGVGLSGVRSKQAKYWLPNESEWYKAAYHDASAGVAAVYFDYATRSNSLPASDHPADDPSAVNYFNDDRLANGFNGGYAVTDTAGRPVAGQNYLTDVGAYSAATSPYGTFDQNGNVWEWNETVFSASLIKLRGGSFWSESTSLRVDNGFDGNPSHKINGFGFRVATLVPEPSTLLMGALAAMGLLMRRRG